MINVVTTVTIEKPVEEVWRFMSDLDNAPKWDLWAETEPISSGPPGKGWQVRTVGRFLGIRLASNCTFTEWEPNQTMKIYSRDFGPLKDASLTFTLESLDGRTCLTRRAIGRPWGIWRLIEPIGAWAVAREKDILLVKERVESGG